MNVPLPFTRWLGVGLLLVLGLSIGCDSAAPTDADLRVNLEAPVPVAPQATDTIPVRTHFLVAWAHVPEASGYECEVRALDQPDAPPLVHRTAHPNASMELSRPGAYAWKVRALDAGGRPGYWSAPVRFTIGP